MAINKKLIHFKNRENFDNEVANGNILNTSIVFIQDSKEINTHGTTYKSVNWSVLIPPPTVGDIVYWDSSKLKVCNRDKYSSTLGTAVGVVVIPEGMLPDGKARFVALQNAGSTTDLLTEWGSKTDTSLTNYTMLTTTDNAGSTTTGSDEYGYLPSDDTVNFSGATSYVDPKTKYYGNTPYIPSPYLADGSLNVFYCQIGNNALSDFNGLSNTEVLVGLGTGYGAANDAKNYAVDGVDIDWYLPAAGELGFLVPRLAVINESIAVAGGVAIPSSGIWSSTEYSSGFAYSVNTSDGSVNKGSKLARRYVCPFAIID